MTTEEATLRIWETVYAMAEAAGVAVDVIEGFLDD